jgi:hypothetical protein
MLFFPIIFGWGSTCKRLHGEWFCSSSLYSVERPWTYGISWSSWLCSRVPDNNHTTTCGYIEVPWKRERSYCCGHDDEGNCDCTAWECVSDGSKYFSFTSLRVGGSSSMGYTYGGWDTAKFDAVLDEMKLNSVAQHDVEDFITDYGNDSRILGYVSDAWLSAVDAKNLSAECRASPAYSSILGRIGYYNSYSGYEPVSYETYRNLVAPGGYTIPSYHGKCSDYEPVPANADDCKGYPAKWMEAVDYGLNAMELSFDNAGKKVEDAEDIHNDLKKKGVCDEEYAWSPRNACVELEDAFTTIDSGDSSTRSYGQWNLVLSLLEELKIKSQQHPPDMKDYPEIMKHLWQQDTGFIPLVSELTAEGENASEEAENIYNSYIDGADGYKTGLDEKYDGMRNNELSKITESLTMYEIEEEGFGSIAERFSDFETDKNNADDAYDNAKSMRGNTGQQSYLRLATESASEAESIYGSLADEADNLLEDAEQVVDEKRSQAQAALNQAASMAGTGSRTDQYYSLALSYFNAGENTDILGRKYENYAKAESYAWMALGETGAFENQTSSLIIQLEDLLRRAEMDEINVATEKEMFSYLKSIESERDISNDLQSLVSSVLSKADIKYGYLLDVREELLENITASGNCGADLRTSMENSERGIISGGRIDYMNGIGRLSGLGLDYEEISVELSLCEEMILSNSLVKSSSLLVERVKIDESSDAALTVLITNPTSKSGVNVRVEIDVGAPLPVLYSDVKSGSEYLSNVIVEGDVLTLTMNEIGPYRTYSMRFETDAVLATTTSLDSYAEGIGDGKVRVEEERRFQLDADGVYLDVLPEESSVVSADIDGRSIDGIFEKGSHTLSVVYIMSNAYSENKTDIDATQIGTNTQLGYDILVLPEIKIDELPLTITMDYSNVSGASVSAVYGATMAEKDCMGNVCNIKLLNLEAGEEAKVSVSYMILGTTGADISAPAIPDGGHCIDGIEKLCGPLPETINQTIAMINAAGERGDHATAIELKEQLKTEIEKWERNQQSMADGYLELLSCFQAEKEEIGKALENSEGIDDSLITDLENRNTELTAALDNADSAATISGALDALRSIDRDWMENKISDYKTESWNGYNDLKKRLFEAGITTMPNEFMDVEDALKDLGETGSPVDAVELAKSLEAAENLVANEEAKVGEKTDSLHGTFLGIKENLTLLIDNYNEQMDEAKGTQWEGIFTVDSSGVSSLLSEIDDMFGNEDNRLIEKKMELLDKKKGKIEKVMDQLKSEASNILQTAQGSFEAKKNQIPGGVRNSLENGISMMNSYIASGNYIKALKTGQVVIRELGNYSEGGGGVNVVLVILAVLAVGAAGAAYWIKKKGGGEIKLPFLKKEEKPIKRLEKAEQ